VQKKNGHRHLLRSESWQVRQQINSCRDIKNRRVSDEIESENPIKD
jgi:hypothetical protein